MGEKVGVGFGRLHVGWSSVSITPDVPVQLAGQFYERVSEHVRDPLLATALALETRQGEQGLEQAVIVSCDLTNIPDGLQDRVKQRVAANVPGLDVAKIFLAATHTHTAPVLRPGFYPEPGPGVMHPLEYIDLLVERVAQAIEQAWQSLEPAAASWGLGHATVGFNRRLRYRGGEARMYGKADDLDFLGLEGARDPGVELLFLWQGRNSAGRRLSGVVVNVCCPSQVVMHESYISADYWSAVRDYLHQAYGDTLHILPLCGAAGDQCPYDHVRRGRGDTLRHEEESLDEIGRRIAWAVDDVLTQQEQVARAELPFGHIVEELSLPARRVSHEEWLEARASLEALRAEGAAEASSTAGRARRLQKIVDAYHQQPDHPLFPMELHVLRLGDVALTSNPFELFLDYGWRIKARSPATQTFIAQLACRRGAYLPTAKAIPAGSYSTNLAEAPVGPEGGGLLVERTVDLMAELWAA